MKRRTPPNIIGRYVLFGLCGLLLFFLLLKAADTTRMMAGFFNSPFQLDESEGMIVVETLLLDRGQNIFAPIDNRMFVAAPYPPLFYLLNWPLAHFVGVSFKIGRAISLLATMATAASIFLAVFMATRDRLAGLVAGIGWLCLAVVGFWGALVKPDMTSVAFGLAGLVVALSSRAGAATRLWWALPLFWAAFLTKQTAVAPALAVCIWLLLWRWRTGLRFTALYAVGAIGATLLLDLWTGGGYFYHEFTLHDLPWDAAVYLNFVFGLLSVYWPLLLAGSLAVVVCGLFVVWQMVTMAGGLVPLIRKVGSLREIVPPVSTLRFGPMILLLGYWAAGLGVATGAGTHGGNHNHLLEWTAGCLIGFGVLVHLLISQRKLALQVLSGAVLLLLVLFANPLRASLGGVLPSVYDVPGVMMKEYRVSPADLIAGWSNIAQYVSNTSGPVYSNNVGLLLITDKWHEGLWSTDPFTQTHATWYGRWDESALIAAILNKEFALIVLPYDPTDIAARLELPDYGQGDVSHGIMRAVQQAYEIDQRNAAFIYKPKP